MAVDASNRSTARFDAFRKGLSFRDEVRLLTGLQFCRPEQIELPPQIGTGWPQNAWYSRLRTASTWIVEERDALVVALKTDVVDAPHYLPPHSDWVENTQQRLPVTLRNVTVDVSPHSRHLGHPRQWWTETAVSLISGRLRRCPRDDVGGILVLAAPEQSQVIRSGSELAMSFLVQGLPGRERMSLYTVLGADFGRRLESLRGPLRSGADSGRDAEVRDTLRRGLRQVSKTASSAEHVMNRTDSFVLALALDSRFRQEAVAMARSLNRRDGKRLLRFRKSLGTVGDRVGAAMRLMLLSALTN